ncbi:MAG: hypothetical protein KKE62_19140 [Proteobacteria bacterium]|nr:hypothetical protein [Pseudomonadota bacterium]MBU1390094.1 hypothetical protein [Pseudomonadota bacterium]MBU1544955.1 hypothetical protein [Pseudomonadota bacterium]MBU2482291.1 hypothetical protein [Pseudomonadota bacterium]
MKKIIILFVMLLTVCATTIIVPQTGYALIVNSGNTYNNYGVVDDYIWIYGTFINTPGAALNTLTTPGVLNVGRFENRANGTVNNYTQLANFPESTYMYNYGAISNYTGSKMGNGGTLTNYAGGEITNYAGSTLSNYGTLTNAGILTNAGTFDQYYAISQSPARKLVNSGTLTNSGTIKIATKTSLENSGNFNNSGALNIAGMWVSQYVVGPVNLTNTGTLTNSGSLNITGTPYSSNSFVQALLTNRGLLTLTGTGTLTSNNGTLKNYNTLTNHGTMTSTTSNYVGDWGRIYNYSGATIDNYGTMTTNHILDNYGTIRNYGTLEASYMLNNLSGATLTNHAGAKLGGGLYNYGTLHNSGRMTLLHNYGTSHNHAGATQQDGALFNYGMLSNNAGATLSGAFGVTNGTDAVLNNYGTMNHWYSDWYGQSTDNSGTLNNYGMLSNSRTLKNAGTLVNNSGATLNNSGYLDNSGMLKLLESSVTTGMGTYTQTAGQTINNGTFTQALVDIQGGTLSGNGTINGDVTLASTATLSPGNSPGTMSINGSYSQAKDAILEIELGSTSYDILNITGTASLAGILQVVLYDDYIPENGSSYSFMTASDGIMGDFDSIRGPGSWLWTVDYQNIVSTDGTSHTAVLTARNPVPIPTTAWLLGSGLLGLLGVRRKIRK